MSQVDLLRKIIREEVRKVVREELKSFLVEARVPVTKPSYANTIKESVQKAKPASKPVYSDDPIKQLLAETAYGMDTSEYKTMMNAGSDMAQGFPQLAMQYQQQESFTPQPQVVESVSEMLASARPTTDINQVSIDTVPDFSELMQTMKAKGQI
jgi:tRNA isopentenyl-2-thiomethyl-A-37 hydroxylase MiaE